jgi:hypothetical protein
MMNMFIKVLGLFYNVCLTKVRSMILVDNHTERNYVSVFSSFFL